MGEAKQRDVRMITLEERVAHLEEVLDTNSAVFRDSLELAELCIQALQRALDDAVVSLRVGFVDYSKTPLKTVEVEGTRKVDYKSYLKEAMELRLATEKAAEKPSEAETLPAPAPVFEFGG